MRPNLSLSNIAATLAALGTSAVITVACGGAQEPSKSPASATDSSAQPTAAGGHASCSANGSCGANKGTAQGQSSCSAKTTTDSKPADGTMPTTPATGAAAGGAGGATATAVTPPPANTATPPAPTTATTAKKPPSAKPSGQSSCGAGTCAADAKKK